MVWPAIIAGLRAMGPAIAKHGPTVARQAAQAAGSSGGGAGAAGQAAKPGLMQQGMMNLAKGALSGGEGGQPAKAGGANPQPPQPDPQITQGKRIGENVGGAIGGTAKAGATGIYNLAHGGQRTEAFKNLVGSFGETKEEFQGGMKDLAKGNLAGAATKLTGSFTKLWRATDDYAQAQERANQTLTQYSGEVAAAYQMSEAGRINRDIEMARRTGGGAARLAENNERLREAYAPFERIGADLSNKLSNFFQDWKAWALESLKLGETAEKIYEKLLGFDESGEPSVLETFIRSNADEYNREAARRKDRKWMTSEKIPDTRKTKGK